MVTDVTGDALLYPHLFIVNVVMCGFHLLVSNGDTLHNGVANTGCFGNRITVIVTTLRYERCRGRRALHD